MAFLKRRSTEENFQSSKKLKSDVEIEPEEKEILKNRIDESIVIMSIENLNLVRQGIIVPDDVNLEEIYEKRDFDMNYSNSNKLEDASFDIFNMTQIVWPHEKHADHMLMIIAKVFSNSINCTYFTLDELNFVFSLLTLAKESQQLFVRLYKRKLSWHRISSLSYDDVASNLEPYFDELVKKGFCLSDVGEVDIADLMKMLSVDEVRKICQKLKVAHQGKKPDLIEKLIKSRSTKKSFFVGAKPPIVVLKEIVEQTLKKCVCLPPNVINLFDRLFVLFNPVQDPSETAADLLLLLNSVHYEDVVFPCVPKKIFPIFKNRDQLINFTDSKNSYRNLLNASEKKDWEIVKEMGNKAFLELKKLTTRPKCALPAHVKKFLPEYMWFKTASKSIDAFKKSPDTMSVAVDILNTLINFNENSSNARLVNQLALIEMHHKKDLESSASLMLQLLEQKNFSIVDARDAQDRVEKLLKRKSGVSKETRILLEDALEATKKKYPVLDFVNVKTISATLADRFKEHGKSTWTICNNGGEKHYGSVESVALQHYADEENFAKGLHCEGSLPVSLFVILFWDVLYDDTVPGAFVTAYQDAPLDLFTHEFQKNREQALEEKIDFYKNLDVVTFSDYMRDKYAECCKFRSILPPNLFANEEQVREIALCLGIKGVIGICEKLISNFTMWHSGFPDLILWNISNLTSKIIEVKGPKDTLSIKQTLWLEHLKAVGIDAEVCNVAAT